MRYCRFRLVPVVALLLVLRPTLSILAQRPGTPSYLIQVTPTSMTQRARILSLGLDVLAESEGTITAVATEEQLDRLRDLAADPVVLEDGALSGSYYLLPVDDPGAVVARESALAVYPQGPGHLLVRVDARGEELLWRQASSLKRLFGGLPLLPRVASRPDSVASSQGLIQEMVDEVSQFDLSEHVRNLQDDDSAPGWDALRSRYSFSPELDVEKEYIRQHFSDLGLQVEYDPFTLYGHGGTVEISNVVATLPGTDALSERVYIICAHYDSTAARSPGWDWETDPAPGADDNATGTAVAMEAGRVLSQYEFAHTIRFVAFAGEEQGLWGSQHYAEAAWAAGDNIAGVINLDMVGYNPVCDKADFLGDPASEWLVDAIRDNAAQYGIDIITEEIISACFTYSDHSSFWDYGYPAILGIEDYQPWSDSYCYEANHNYHTVTDTYSTLNTDLLEKTTKLTVATIAELAQPVTIGVTSTLYLPLIHAFAEAFGSSLAP